MNLEETALEYDPPIIQSDDLEYFGYQLSGKGFKNEAAGLKIFGLKTLSGLPAEVSFCCGVESEDEGFFLPHSFKSYQEDMGLEEVA